MILAAAVWIAVAAVDSACIVPRGDTVTLLPGQSATRPVYSCERRNHTGIMLVEGSRYSMTADGVWQDGKLEPTGPAGFGLGIVPWYFRPGMFAAQPFRRSPGSRWFALVGEISTKRGEFFTIGTGCVRWEAPASGELVAFANDINFRYGNNKGAVSLTVRRIE